MLAFMNNMKQKLKLHRNSQKRYYIDNAIYFITTNTFKGYPYFEIDVLSELLVEELRICQQIQKFKLFGYKINPEHIHLLIQPNEKYNYSVVMNSLKTNFARDANRVLGYFHLKARSRDLAFGNDFKFELLQNLRNQFIKQYGIYHNIPKFKWQSSFHDHIIRNDFDYFQHLKYIQNQWIRHKLSSNKWCWVIGENRRRFKS